MTKIIASAQQRKCRNLFKEAVDYANKVYADPVKKKEWTNKSRKKHRVFNYIIREYMLAAKEAATKRQEIGIIIIRKCFPHLQCSALSSQAQALSFRAKALSFRAKRGTRHLRSRAAGSRT